MSNRNESNTGNNSTNGYEFRSESGVSHVGVGINLGYDGRVLFPFSTNSFSELASNSKKMVNILEDDDKYHIAESYREYTSNNNSINDDNGIAAVVNECSEYEEVFHVDSKLKVIPFSRLPKDSVKKINNYLGIQTEKEGTKYFAPTGTNDVSISDNYIETLADQEHFT